jgi:uracil-DNA glycosylase family 4
VPGFGDPEASILIVGLAPAAHGGNRTGRVFTGDASGDFLWRSMHEMGLADRAWSRHAGDGLTLRGVRVAAAVRCAPPANRPTTEERDTCLPYLERELAILSGLRVVVVLGGFAYDAFARVHTLPKPRPKFGHAVEVDAGDVTVVCCYHPSQQNTFTGKLTEPMTDAVFARARELAARDQSASSSPTA